MIARLALVLSFSLSLAAQTTSAPKRSETYHVAGVVVNSITNQPLGGVKVSIYRSESPEYSQHTNTGADGRFGLAGVPAGKYTLMGSGLGYRAQGFHQHGDYFIGIAVGPELDSEHILFQLVADARIEGSITNEEGEAVRNANVTLYERNHDTGRQQTRQITNAATDDRGHYLFSHLGPGTYFVAVSARPWYAQYQNADQPPVPAQDARRFAEERTPLDVAYPMTFYPSAEDSSGAAPIVLHPGDRITADISVRAVPAVHLRLKTADPQHGQGRRNIATTAFPRVSQRIFEGALVPVMSSQGSCSPNGGCDYTGIAPGRYVIEMPSMPSGGGKHGGWYKEMDLSGTVELDPGESPPLASVTGAMQFEGASRPPGRIYVVLAERNSGEDFAAEVTPKGTFDFSEMEVRPGFYDVAINAAQSYQIRSVQATGAKVTAQTIEISGGAVQLALTTARTRASINGTVTNGDKAFPGAMVVLVPQDPMHNLTLFRRDQSDSDGTFTLREVLPGSYTVVALQNGWELDWASPSALQKYLKSGTPVDVTGDSKLSIKVQLQR